MPLKRGKSVAVVRANIRKLVLEGYSVKRAVAVAFERAGLSRKKRK